MRNLFLFPMAILLFSCSPSVSLSSLMPSNTMPIETFTSTINITKTIVPSQTASLIHCKHDSTNSIDGIAPPLLPNITWTFEYINEDRFTNYFSKQDITLLGGTFISEHIPDKLIGYYSTPNMEERGWVMINAFERMAYFYNQGINRYLKMVNMYNNDKKYSYLLIWFSCDASRISTPNVLPTLHK